VRYQEEKRCLEALEKQKREQEETLAENIRQANKRKEDILTQLQSQVTKEEELTKEQNTARELVSEANKKLSEAVNQNNMQSAKVAQIMLSSGNDHLTRAPKPVEGIMASKTCSQFLHIWTCVWLGPG